MPCCQATEHAWCKDKSVVYKGDDGNEYCIFHAPKDKKGLTNKKFQKYIFDEIVQTRGYVELFLEKDGGLLRNNRTCPLLDCFPSETS
jgi:hypothetical protein